MNVIKPGELKRIWYGEVQCPECKAVLLVKHCEIHSRYCATEMRGSKGKIADQRTYHTTCMECGNHIYVRSEYVPGTGVVPE